MTDGDALFDACVRRMVAYRGYPSLYVVHPEILAVTKAALMKGNKMGTNERFEADYSELFRFKVGDTVVLKGDVDRFKATLMANGSGLERGRRFSSVVINPPVTFTVTTQFLERCHGGFQRHYGLCPRTAETGSYTIEDTLEPASAVVQAINLADENYMDTEDRKPPES